VQADIDGVDVIHVEEPAVVLHGQRNAAVGRHPLGFLLVDVGYGYHLGTLDTGIGVDVPLANHAHADDSDADRLRHRPIPPCTAAFGRTAPARARLRASGV